MSDPMTNTEVEDVLASIRRLVSDDKRPEAQPVQKPPTDRLVLTPSLRVMEDTRDQAAEPEPDTATDDADDDAALTAFAAAAFGKRADAAPVENDDAQDAHDTAQSDEIADELDAIDNVHDAAQGDDVVLVLGGEAADDVGQEPDAAAVADFDDMGDDHAVDAQDDASGMDAAPDVAPDVNVPEDWADDTDDAAAAADDAAVADADLADTRDMNAPENAKPASQTLSEKIAALEMLVGKRSDQFEPDDPGADAYAGTEPPAMEWEDADEAPAYVAYVDAQAERDDDAPSQIFSSDEDVLDEEALRELVSDIVREELQGALGERITRNVRKLVRREIHRALAAQDLE